MMNGVTETEKAIDILRVIQWAVNALKEVSDNTTKNCFEICSVVEELVESDDELDEKLTDLFRKFTCEIQIGYYMNPKE